jgi:tetratricopeptide (TPR) repeat protein
VLLELAAAEALAGRPSAGEHLAAVMDADPTPAERAQAAAALGRLLALDGRPEEAIGLLERELGAAGPELAPALLAELLSVAQVHPATRPRLRARLHDLRTARFSADTPVGRRLLAMQGLERALACDPVGEALASTWAALAGGRLLAEETADSPTYQEAVNVLSHVGECEQAERLRDAAIADAGARGSVFAYALSSALRPL